MKLTFNALNFPNPLLSFFIRTPPPSNHNNQHNHQTNPPDSSQIEPAKNSETQTELDNEHQITIHQQQHNHVSLDDKPPDDRKPSANGQPQQVANSTPEVFNQDERPINSSQADEGVGGACASSAANLSPTGPTTGNQVTNDSRKTTSKQEANKRNSQDKCKRTVTGVEEMPPAHHHHHPSQRRATTTGCSLELPVGEQPLAGPSLVDRLIDSQLEWRRLISEANGSHGSLSQLSELQIKRQEVIHELVQTERHHCLTLALMRQVYLNGLRQLNESRSFRSESLAHHHQQHHQHHQVTTNSSSQLISIPSSLNPTSQPLHGTAPAAAAAASIAISNTNSNQTTTTSDLIDLDRLFPALEDLIQAHELFFAHLRLRLVESCRAPAASGQLVGLVGPLGDLLCDQFRLHQPTQQHTKGDAIGSSNNNIKSSNNNNNNNNQQPPLKQQPANGHKLLQAYAKFCGQHYDSSRYYKHLMQNDKGFKQFIEQCNKLNASCRQRGIPECNLLVTQRLTKYPLLIEQLIKTSKDDQQEEQKLREALKECKGLLAELNNQLARKESFERLLDIYAQFSPKSYTIYNRHLKFTKHDLLQHKRLRQLLHSDGQVRIWSATRRKLFQVLCLILNDIVVFLKIESSSTSSSSVSASVAPQASGGPPPATHHNHLYQHHLSAGTGALESPELEHLSSPPGSLMIASSPNLSSIQQPAAAAVSAASGGSLTGGGGAAGSFNIKYYFANIDNKSSVISLSKLLVREKAATDQEPRVYLISSSPRQPEMYELAFLSKRHQTSFVEKLKACVDQHNKSLALEGGHDALDLDDGEEDEEVDDDDYVYEEDEDAASDQMELLHHGGHDLSSGCLCDEADNDHKLYDEDDDDYADEERGVLSNRTLDNSADEEEQVERCGRRAHEELEGDADDEMGQRFCRARRCADGRLCRRCKPETAPPTTGAGKTTKRPTSGELDEFELDIEQDVVPEPVAANLSSGSEGPTSYTTYETPEGTCDVSLESGNVENCPDSHHKGLCEAGSRPSSSEPEASNESGLSERAKDSLDEAAPSKQKLRANRRRRAQRPRNISNQSSSSSEAAHLQAIQLISSTDKQPPVGCCGSDLASASASASTTATASTTKYEEEFDSGRGHDDSSSAASTSSNSLGSRSIVSLPNSCHNQKQQVDTDLDGKCPMSCNKSSGCKEKKLTCPVADVKVPAQTPNAHDKAGAMPHTSGSSNSNPSCASASGRTVACATTCANKQGNNTSGSNLIKCPSILSKSSCSFVKQRKLSTVSTMSSQLKLISKLKSNFADGHSVCCLQCSQRQGGQRASCNHRHQQTQLCAADSPAAPSAGCCYSCASQQSTLNKQIRQHMRRSTFIPEQKLEELRDLRIQLDKDKQEWQAKFDRMQEQLLNERRELDLAREKLKQDRQQVANEREQLYRKLDVLKAKGILLSPSHKVIITTPELRIYPPNGNSTDGYINHQQQNNYGNQNSNSFFNGTIHLQNQRQQQQQQQQQQHHSTMMMNQENHSSTIQIVNQQSPQSHHRYSSQNPQLSPLASSAAVSMNTSNSSISYPTSYNNDHLTTTTNNSNRCQRSSSSNLFIRSNGKVPLHLSEGSTAAPQTQKSSTMSLMSKVSLISSSGGSLLAERLCGSASTPSKVSGGMESHVI